MANLSAIHGTVFGVAPTGGSLGSIYAVVYHGPRAYEPPAETPPEDPCLLLDVDLGARPLRFATREITIPSRTDGGSGRLYRHGLSDLDVALGSDSVAVDLPIPDAAAIRRQVGPLVGRPFVLRLYRGEPVLEDATVLLQGVVGSSARGNPDSPEIVQLELTRATEDLSTAIVPASAQIDRGNWPNADDRIRGAFAPVVLGAPGRSSAVAWFNWQTYPASPALYVDTSGLSRVLLLAYHHVAATQVEITDLSNGATITTYTATVTNTADSLGADCATCTVPVSSIAVDNTTLFASWGANGNGLVFEGTAIVGLGDVLIWGARTYSRLVHDLGRMRSEAARLNRFQIDAVINDPAIRWDEWVTRNILDVYGIERVDGTRGVWYREARFVPDETAIRATLTTDASRPGVMVRRVSPYVDEEIDGVTSEIQVNFATDGNGATQRRVTLTSSRDAVDPRVAAYVPCRRSRELYGIGVPRVVTCGTTAHVPTAWEIAKKHADRYAVPWQLVTFSGPLSLYGQIEAYDTVEIYDADDGGIRTLGVVQPDIQISERSAQVTVRVP